MPRRGPAWTASVLITFFGVVTNSALTVQVLAASRSIKWEPESDWELSGGKWQLTGIKVIWALLSLYFASAAAVCSVGFHGVIKHKPSHVRFYRDYSIADFSFCAFFTLLATYGAFLSPARAGVCEELSHHPELMRDLLEIGINLENCELWFERAVFAGLAIMFVAMIIRLHFLLAVSNYYSHLVSKQYYGHYHHHHHHHHGHQQRISSCSCPSSPNASSSSIVPLSPTGDSSTFPSSSSTCCSSSSSSSASASGSSHSSQSTHINLHTMNMNMNMKRIYILPTSSIANSTLSASLDADVESGVVEVVYAPVPKHTLPKELQEQAALLEGWVPSSPTGASSNPACASTANGGVRRHHGHGHHRRSSQRSSHSHSQRRRSESRDSRETTTGRIKLEIAPDEGLLPPYVDVDAGVDVGMEKKA